MKKKRERERERERDYNWKYLTGKKISINIHEIFMLVMKEFKNISRFECVEGSISRSV